MFSPLGEIIWWDSSGELLIKGVNFTKAEARWFEPLGLQELKATFLCFESTFFAHEFVVLKPGITGFMCKDAPSSYSRIQLVY